MCISVLGPDCIHQHNPAWVSVTLRCSQKCQDTSKRQPCSKRHDLWLKGRATCPGTLDWERCWPCVLQPFVFAGAPGILLQFSARPPDPKPRPPGPTSSPHSSAAFMVVYGSACPLSCASTGLCTPQLYFPAPRGPRPVALFCL